MTRFADGSSAESRVFMKRYYVCMYISAGVHLWCDMYRKCDDGLDGATSFDRRNQFDLCEKSRRVDRRRDAKMFSSARRRRSQTRQIFFFEVGGERADTTGPLATLPQSVEQWEGDGSLLCVGHQSKKFSCTLNPRRFRHGRRRCRRIHKVEIKFSPWPYLEGTFWRVPRFWLSFKKSIAWAVTTVPSVLWLVHKLYRLSLLPETVRRLTVSPYRLEKK